MRGRARAAAGEQAPEIFAPWSSGAWFAAVHDSFLRQLARESDYRTGFLWLPIAFGLGILGYFAASEEPWLWAAPILAGLVLPLTMIGRGFFRILMLTLLLAALGFGAASFRTMQVASPMLDRDHFVEVKGFIETIEDSRRRQRLVVRPTQIEGFAKHDVPFRLRIGMPGKAGAAPGDFIAVRARLMPASEAALPGGYDFRRDSFFRSTGGVGYSIGPLRRETTSEPPPLDLRVNAAIDRWRNTLTERIAVAIGGDAGALSAALITGKRGLISATANDDLRGAGLYHIVSISGLHMVLAAGVLFWSIRAFLAAVPAIALAHPIKKYAAAAAMVGATAYCIFSGSEVATERSLIMTLVMLGAILVDRPALAMRNLAFSALIVMAREPEAILGPSFQMSFAAVASLIAANQVWSDWKIRHLTPVHGLLGGFLRKLGFAFLGIAATTIVATLATAPFSAFHFHRLNPYGIIGNSLGIPLVSLVVMPAAVAGTLLVPFGLDGIIWRIMGEGVAGVLLVAQWVASIENASVTAPNMQGFAFALLVTALIVFVALRTSLRWLSLLFLAGWLVVLKAQVLPDLVIDPSGKIALVRGQDGRYHVLSVGTANRFTLSQWLPALGDNRSTDAPSLRENVRCDKNGCVTRTFDGRQVALVTRVDQLREDCRRADIVITPLARIGSCNETKLLAREHFDRFGATKITTRHAGEWQVETGLDPSVNRPWRRKARPASPLSSTPSNTSSFQNDPRNTRGPNHAGSDTRYRNTAAPPVPVAETLDDDPALTPERQRLDQ